MSIEPPARLICLLLSAFAGGCAFRVTPPVAVREPIPVFIVDYGAHASLVVPRDEANLVEYAYGEWGWFAKNEQQWYRGPAVMLCPSDGALGMRPIGTEPTVAALNAIVRAEAVHDLRVEKSRARSLLTRLDAEFAAGGEPELNSMAQMLFVPYPRKYCACAQCNTLVSEWLQELGCRVTGGGLVAEFVIAERP